jgi:zinc D-Ala-D-Ala carboxypeptidase
MQLSEHFSYAELTCTSHRTLDNTPDERALLNLRRLAVLLEELKTLLGGKPVIITSAYRSKAVNDVVGSKDTSQHRLGCAADLRVPGMTPDEVVRRVVDSNLPFDQVIREFATPQGGGWTHISVPNTLSDAPRRSALIIDRAGTRKYGA